MVNQAVILVGGKGERLYEGYRFTPIDETPKPLVEVGGKPFVTYAINQLKGIGISDIVLLVGYKREIYEDLLSLKVRLVETMPIVNEAVLSIQKLDDLFLLLNGDCFPLMDWRRFVDSSSPRVAIKIIGRDAGVALVRREDVRQGKVDCSRIGDMVSYYPPFTVHGGLHIGTIQGLNRARQYIDMAVFGE